MDEVFEYICNNTYFEIEFLEDEIDHKRIDERNYTRELLKDVPVRSGIYFFFNRNKQLVYIGRAGQLRQTINAQIRGNYPNTMAYKRWFAYVAYIACDVYEAKKLQIQMIKDLQPAFNITHSN